MIIGDGVNPMLMTEIDSENPQAFSLDAPYPNPFNPTTTISYVVGNEGFVNVMVYDISGRVIENLVSEYQAQGEYSVVWNARSLPSGLYFVKFDADNYSATQKLMLVK